MPHKTSHVPSTLDRSIVIDVWDNHSKKDSFCLLDPERFVSTGPDKTRQSLTSIVGDTAHVLQLTATHRHANNNPLQKMESGFTLFTIAKDPPHALVRVAPNHDKRDSLSSY